MYTQFKEKTIANKVYLLWFCFILVTNQVNVFADDLLHFLVHAFHVALA